MTALFPDVPATDLTGFVVAQSGREYLVRIRIAECQRCGAYASNTTRHEAWHRSVDTDETTDLHRFPAPTPVCGAIEPVSGFRCRLPAQHTGDHNDNATRVGGSIGWAQRTSKGTDQT